MTRRFDLGPILVAAAGILLLVSLFLDWYGGLSAWEVFEVVDMLLAALAVAAVAAAVSTAAPDLVPIDRRWLPWVAAAALIVVAVSIMNTPPAAVGRHIRTGAWIAFGASLAMLAGAVLSLSRVSFSMSLEGREPRQRVAAVDERQPTTETAAIVDESSRRGREEAPEPGGDGA